MIDDLRKTLIDLTKQVFILPQNETLAARMSLASVVKEWCDSINPSAFDHIFSDGTDKMSCSF